MQLSDRTEQKFKNLQNLFREMQKVVVAYSGGVDSTLLLKIGTDILGENCVGVLGLSASLSKDEYKESLALADKMNASLEVINTDELNNPKYLQNDGLRCYHCKYELFSQIKPFAEKIGARFILDGNNVDDKGDYRPGMEAAKELKIRSPFIEADLNKDEIREISKYLNLPTWIKPAQPCLSSRIAYGQSISSELLEKIDNAEKILRNKKFKIVRVRYLGESVSIEVGIEELPKLKDKKLRSDIIHEIQKLGFDKIQFDESGYESGGLNKLLTLN